MSHTAPAAWTTQRLESALRTVLGHEVTADDHATVIAGISGRRLLRLDSILRSMGSYERVDPGMLIARLVGADEPQVALFVAGCDRDGYVRERALRAMRAHSGPIALSLALLRADDHVPQVREAALALLSDVLREIRARHLFDRLDLVFALRARARFDAHAWQTIEQVLLDFRSSGDRWDATRSSVPEVRRYAWRLVALADDDVIDARIADAARDPDSAIAHWALDRAKTDDGWRATADAAAEHPQASVRAEALRLHVARAGDAARPQLERALFDRAQTVRLTASYLLRGHVDAIARWRDAADATDEPARAIGLSALADLAMHEDCSRMLSALSHPISVVRSAALSALARSNPEAARDLIVAGFADPSPRVARVAYRIARRTSMRIPSEVLDARFAEAVDASARNRVIANVDLAGKWESLLLLLKWSAAAPAGETQVLQRALRLWLLADARAQSPIPAGTRAPLAAAIERARFAWPNWPEWERLTFALRTSSG